MSLEPVSLPLDTKLETTLNTPHDTILNPALDTPLGGSTASSSALASRTSHVRTRSTRGSHPKQGRRSKLSTEERAKVLEVRRQRACLRCKMLKIQCSKESPCKSCLSSAVRGFERKVLSFCYCVRTRFTDVDIFHSAATVPFQTVPASVRALLNQIEPPSMPSFEDDIFEDTLIRWLTNPIYSPPDGSIVALLCNTVGSSDSLSRAVDSDLTSDFRTFLFTTSLAHTGWTGPIAHRDLCIAGHLCGSRILRRLDRILTPQFLSRCDKPTHRALLLLVFGLILGVGYSTRLTTSPYFPQDLLGPEIRHSPTLWMAMKEHLAQMLAHHLIFIGSILGIKLDTASEKTIIDKAVNRWDKSEANMWAGIVGDALPSKPNNEALAPTVLQDFNDLSDGSQNHSPAGSQNAPQTLSMPMVAVSFPDFSDLQAMPHVADNPESYLSMTNDDVKQSTGPATDTDEPPSPNNVKNNEGESPHITKRRSVWIVRPFDGGGNRETVNVYARIRLQHGQNIGLFV